MFSSQVTKYKDQLTASELTIAEYLTEKYLKKADDNMMSSEQIARNVNVGQSTIIRFSQKLGYESFKNMMQDLINESFFYSEGHTKQKVDSEEIVRRMEYQYEQSIKEVVSMVDPKDLDLAVELIKNSQSIFFFGLRPSSSIAYIMYYRFLEIGKKTLCSSDLLYSSSCLFNFEKGDVLFIISASGESADCVKLAQFAKKKGLKVISITNGGNNKIQKFSDVPFVCSQYNVHNNRFNLVNRSSELFLIDLIFIKYWYENEEAILEKMKLFSEASEEEIEVNDFVEASFRL